MHIHHDWTITGYLKSIALGFLFLSARMPDLSAADTSTNEMPTKLSALIEEASKVPFGRRDAYLREQLSAIGSEGIELLIGEIKKPFVIPPPGRGEMLGATFAATACEIFAGLGENAYDRLSEELKKDASPVFWENACYVYACSDRDDSFNVLAGWVIENGADPTAKAQVSARAYGRLHNKLLRNHLPAPAFARQDKDLPTKFQQWWQSNRQTVVQQYLEQKKARSEAAKVPDK